MPPALNEIVCPGVTESLQALRDHERQLHETIHQHQKENLQLKFECEQVSLELPRLKARLEDQQEYIEVLKSGAATAGNLRPPQGKKNVGESGRSVADLERVVAAMRKVVENLQRENEGLKKTVSRLKQNKAKDGGDRAGGEETEVRRLKAELQRLQATGETAGKSPYVKITTENDRLRRELKREAERNDQLQLSLSTLEVQNRKLQEEMEKSTFARPPFKAASQWSLEERVERLQAELEVKNQMLSEVKKHLRDAADRERQLQSLSQDAQLSKKYLAVVSERDALQQQVAKLKRELDAFDPSFFEEIEDLKYTCQEAVKRNVQYEEHLCLLSKQYGFSLPLPDT